MTSSIYIAKSVYGGDGIGRLGDGRVVFVPGAFAGEQVKAEIVEEKKNFVRARLVEIEDANPERTGAGAPPIPGMVYANISPKGECAAKAAQLAEFFDRARIPLGESGVPEQPVAGGSPAESLNYRNKVVYHFARSGGGWALGYRTEPEHEIVDVENDPLAAPEINAKLAEVRRNTFALLTQGADAVRRAVERKSNVTIRWTRRSGVVWWLGDAQPGVVLKESACGRAFEVPSDGFWQVNPAVGDALVKSVAETYAQSPTGAILDLYCGVGVLGLSCAAADGGQTPRLTGIESGRQAVEFARRNAALLGVESRFFAEQVGRSLNRIRIDDKTTVIVDPPRGGMEPNVPRWLAASRAPRVLYASCDPATLMRDLRTLSRAYDVESVRWFNMFPRTARFETLVALKRKRQG